MVRIDRRRIGRLLPLLVAVVFVFGPAVALALGVRAKAFENHELATAPDPRAGWEALTGIGPWATDQLPGRERAVRISAWVDFTVFRGLPRTASGNAATERIGSVVSAQDGAPAQVHAPTVVRGRDGALFLGADFDSTCRPALLDRGLRQLRRLADDIQRSGRRVVFMVAPDKSAVLSGALPRVLPHGRCAVDGLERGHTTLSGVRDRRWVDLWTPLADAAARGQAVFWRYDTHWSPSGAVIAGRALAAALDPALAERLTVRTDGEVLKVGDLTRLVGLSRTESAPRQFLEGGGRLVEPDIAPPGPDGRPNGYVRRWTTSPAEGLHPGRTLILGDSFAFNALDAIRPMFADGVLMWNGHMTPEQLTTEVAASDTIVLECVQRLGVASPLTQPETVETIRAAVNANPRGGR